MVRVDHTASRWILAALGFAVWCTATVWGLLELTRPYPGIVSMKPGRGAFELSEAAFHMPAGKALLVLFLIAFFVVMTVGGLRRLLDPDRMAVDAVLWVLRSKTLWLALAGTVLLSVAGLSFPSGTGDYVIGASEIAGLVFMFLTPFAAWNARTLRESRLSAWWRPRWPGWQAIVLAVGIAAMGGILELSVSLLPRLTDSTRTLFFANVADEAVSFLAWLFLAIAWIERSTIEAAWRSFLRFLHWRRLRALLWQTLLAAVVAMGVAVPILMAVVLAIYVVPQYEEFARVSGVPLIWPLRAMWQVSRRLQELMLFPAVLVALQFGLAQGRLLVSLGIADRSQDR